MEGLCVSVTQFQPGNHQADWAVENMPSLSLPLCRLAGAGGRKKIFRLSDVLKPLTDAQVEAMKLGAVKRILRAEKAVACSGAAQVRSSLSLGKSSCGTSP